MGYQLSSCCCSDGLTALVLAVVIAGGGRKKCFFVNAPDRLSGPPAADAVRLLCCKFRFRDSCVYGANLHMRSSSIL